MDTLVTAALEDKGLASIRPQIIRIAAERQQKQRFLPLLMKLIESENAEESEAAWGVMSYRFDEQSAPVELVNRLLSSPDGTRQGRGLWAAYASNLPDLPARQALALEKGVDGTANVAIAMLGQQYLDESFDIRVPYRRGNETTELRFPRSSPGRAAEVAG